MEGTPQRGPDYPEEREETQDTQLDEKQNKLIVEDEVARQERPKSDPEYR